MTAAAIYKRISDDRTGRALGVGDQSAQCQAHCERNGWDVVGEFEDNDISASGYSKRKRPGYSRMLELVEQGKVTVIVAAHIDRLYRKPRELEDLIELVQGRGIRIVTLSGDFDLETAAGQLVARMLVAAAANESANTSRRVTRMHQRRREAGLPPTGARMFGLQPDGVTEEPEEAAALRVAAARVIAGGSLRGQCRAWTEAGLLTTLGNPWSRTTLKRLLQNPRVRPIIGVEVYEAVTAILSVPLSAVPGAQAQTYLLTCGLSSCGHCGTDLRAGNRDSGQRTYKCASGYGEKGCGGVSRSRGPVDAYVTEELLAHLDASGRKPWDEDPEAARLGALVAKYRARLEVLETEYAVEEMWTKQEFVKRRAQLETRISDAQQALAGRPGLGGSVRPMDPATAARLGVNAEDWEELVSSWRAWWAQADVDEQRGLIAREVRDIRLYSPGKGRTTLDQTTVQIDYRDDPAEMCNRAA